MAMIVDSATETDPWEPGTIVYGARNHWRITSAEPVESKVWPWRWRYTVVTLGPHGGQVPAGAATVGTYRRGEGPVDHFGPAPA